MKVLVTLSHPTLCDPTDCSLLGFSVHGISQARHWSRLPFPSPGDLLNPGIEAGSPALQADSLLSEPPSKPIYMGFIYQDILIKIHIYMIYQDITIKYMQFHIQQI